MKFLSRFGSVILMFVPLLSILLGILLVETFPYGMYALGFILVALAFTMLGIGIAKMIGNAPTGKYHIDYKAEQSLDELRSMNERIRRGNMQDGKFY